MLHDRFESHLHSSAVNNELLQRQLNMEFETVAEFRQSEMAYETMMRERFE